MNTPNHIPTIPAWDENDIAGWLIGAARDALKQTEAEEPAETLIMVLQAHALLGVAVEKLQAAAVAETPDRRARWAS